MLAAFSLGFLLGFAGLAMIEGLALLWLIRRLGRKKSTVGDAPEDRRETAGDLPATSVCNKQGYIWVLEPDKVAKLATDTPPTDSSKDSSDKKNITEVIPVKKYANIKDRSLVISDLDNSQAITILLTGCTVVSISGSDLSSRKWHKRYPIKLENNESAIYNGSKVLYLYAETSWEKESWCQALRLESSPEKSNNKNWYSNLIKEFHEYLSTLNSNYPSFLKPSVLSSDSTDKQNKPGVNAKVGFFLKKLAKKATTKSGLESKTSTGSSEESEIKIGDKSWPLFGIDSVNDFENFSDDEGTLCLNVLFSRLFFDAKRSNEINNFIKSRIQRSLSSMRKPNYVGKITCTNIDLGTVPPYINKMRVLPMNLDELWSLEFDFEYLGGIKLELETRIEIHEPELQKDILQNSTSEESNNILESIEQFGNNLTGEAENRQEEKEDEIKQTKNSGWASSYMSRWKTILHSISDQVSQVPLSLEVKANMVRGTLRLYIKPPPSDQIWFGFPSMPEIEWNLETSIGDRKISNNQIALLIGNRIKAAISENMVLPNCENITIPWMQAEKDDWVERKYAPFIWRNQDSTETKSLKISQKTDEAKSNLDSNNNNNKKEETKRETKRVKFVHDNNNNTASDNSSENVDLKRPLLCAEKSQDSQERGDIGSSRGETVIMEEQRGSLSNEEEIIRPKKMGTKAKMMDFGRRVGDKLEEKRRHIEEKSRHIVEKMKENART